MVPGPPSVRRWLFIRLLRWRIKLRYWRTAVVVGHPFWERNLFWGAFGFCATLGIAAIGFGWNGDTFISGWLLIAACPFAILASRSMSSMIKRPASFRLLCWLGLSGFAISALSICNGWLESRNESHVHAIITTNLTIDRSKPSIRQWKYLQPDGQLESRPIVEVYASDWLVANNLKAFDSDDSRYKVTWDLVLFSLTSFMKGYDAQLWKTHPHHIGSLLRFHTDPGRKCKLITEAEIRSQLHRSGNLFAEAPISVMLFQPTCLPVGSTFSLSSNSLVIKNQRYEISFALDASPSGSSAGANYQNPGDGELSKLANGEARFETRAVGLDIKETYFPDRISSGTDSKEYKEWGSALVRDVKRWFEN